MVKIESCDTGLIAYLSGEIDHHCAREIREQIDGEVMRGSIKKLCLDFKNVTFMDSSGIGLVMGRYKLLSSVGGSVLIANCAVSIKRIMKLAGMDKLVEIS